MGYGNEPRDDSADLVPISTSYVPDTGFVAVQGSSNTTVDGDSNESSPVSVNIAQIGEALLALGQKLKAASIPVTLASDQGQAINADTPTETAVNVGVSTTDVLAANANRKFLLLVNDSNNTIYIKLSGNASLNTGHRLNANGGSILFDRYVPTAAVKAIATGTNSNLLVTEG